MHYAQPEKQAKQPCNSLQSFDVSIIFFSPIMETAGHKEDIP